ncbi:VanZ family protein [Tianweitania sediminis]|uniref:VanZ family protein n=1 Tax=Tianweitania sediminis TaxID=1502156 RepID=A0A8J7R6I9_9HYPH|nr:VanZ family protein [Tianweitania sediminis]MBP0438807.1 VanZ family protein [Tianweitania sediminis]
MQRVLLVAAWGSLAAIAFVTLSPIGLRPHVGGPNTERLLAFVLLGCLFGLAHPRRLGLVAAILVAAALSFELLQELVPGRHGRLPDALVKCAGGLAGVAGAALLNRLRGRV